MSWVGAISQLLEPTYSALQSPILPVTINLPVHSAIVSIIFHNNASPQYTFLFSILHFWVLPALRATGHTWNQREAVGTIN
jgi:hypothetical protein